MPLQTGTITDIQDFGSIVMVFIETPEPWGVPVAFDRGSFFHLLKAEDCTAEGLIGRKAS
ncbi:MAG: hypothetical protein NTW19_07965 [Planctomycetota bacterium]|nr:hypothetical protein [Planctomycetota bacterium]